jgi:multiple sugar transport system substrate-binding protein
MALLLIPMGCDRSAGGSTGVGQVVELRFWNGFTGPDGRTMLRIVKQFNEENPDVHVIMQRMPWATYYNKLFVAGLGHRAPEVFISHRSALQRFVAAGFVQSAEPMLGTGPGQIDPNDFDQNILNAVKAKGTHWAIPLDVHPLGMYYNKTLLKQIGYVDAQGNARPPVNRAEFLDVLQKLRPKPGVNPSKATWGYVFTWQRTNVYTMMRQWGGELFKDHNSIATFDAEPNVEALAWCRKLVADGLVPSPENFDSWIGFRQGRVGIAFEGIYMLSDLKKQKDLDWGAAPLPLLGKQRAAWADSHTMCLRKDLDEAHTKAGRRLIKYLSDHSLIWAAGGQVPVRKSLRNSDAFKKMYAPSQFAKQIPYVAYFPPTPFVFEYLRSFDDCLELALRGTKSPKAALEQADQQVQKVIERYREQGVWGTSSIGEDATTRPATAPTTAPTTGPAYEPKPDRALGTPATLKRRPGRFNATAEAWRRRDRRGERNEWTSSAHFSANFAAPRLHFIPDRQLGSDRSTTERDA